jgi:hypothetical protein
MVIFNKPDYKSDPLAGSLSFPAASRAHNCHNGSAVDEQMIAQAHTELSSDASSRMINGFGAAPASTLSLHEFPLLIHSVGKCLDFALTRIQLER